MLTDLIAKDPKYLEWLGDVEWDDVPHFRKRLVCLRANSYYRDRWLPSEAKWMPDGQLSCHEASCILEHAIRVKLENADVIVPFKFTGPGGNYHVPFQPHSAPTYEEALLAAMDMMIKEKEEKDG